MDFDKPFYGLKFVDGKRSYSLLFRDLVTADRGYFISENSFVPFRINDVSVRGIANHRRNLEL